MALGAVGSMGRLLDRSIAYASERSAFGRPIGKLQAIRHKIAEMAVKLEASRSPHLPRAAPVRGGENAIREVTEAKLISQRAAYEVADEALQIHGGAGYMKEYEIERAVRDTRLGPIGGGTDEVMKEILGKQSGCSGAHGRRRAALSGSSGQRPCSSKKRRASSSRSRSLSPSTPMRYSTFSSSTAVAALMNIAPAAMPRRPEVAETINPARSMAAGRP